MKANYVAMGQIYTSEEYGRVKTICHALMGNEMVVVFAYVGVGGVASEPHAMNYTEFLQKFC